MEKTWRWFGKKDKISLSMLRQIGVEGIVTALHDIPNGEVWPLEAINDLKNYIKDAGLRWSVVESLPVSEAIKYGGENADQLIANYIESLANLGEAGINTVCYNFMPVIDWIRTDLEYPWADGTSSLYFDKIRFAYFDCFILNREGAVKDYSAEEMEKVYALDKTITEAEKEQLIDTIIVKTQGFINGNIKEGDKHPVAIFKKLLSLYKDVDRNALRENLKYFLSQLMPVCEEYNINMCIHPDDPPFQMLGLPRIVTNMEDIKWIFNAVDNPYNGLTFCAGSLSASIHNNVPELARRFASRTRFIHLRSTDVFQNGDFIEAPHLEGRGHLIELVRIFEKENPALPMRVDHGRLMLGDGDKGYNPGYSFYGRMYAFAQMDGVIATIQDEIRREINNDDKYAQEYERTF
ncbi:mannonate dehydratase [uncultured Dysgonomonas sp.]|uniref:Mannonate dehydratase n=1 Tax=uncultured Dysgonomonas sp. TaxID=206096 RepID=A0A212JE31_9BACT|nr:mannonate dehydratase [uncultured Dysgonomonas sp.]SBV97703.1 Mannonate dehydratase [uncultured Dysgonomonas sp.]